MAVAMLVSMVPTGFAEAKPDTWIADRTVVVQAYVDDIGYSLPDDQANNPVFQEIKNRTGITLEIQYTPGDNDRSVMASQLASGTIPDVIVSYLNNSARPEFSLLLKAAKDEMFADLSSYLPNLSVYSKYLEDGYLPKDSYKNIVFRKDFNNAVYLLHLNIPRYDRSMEFDPQRDLRGGMYIQKSIVEALGIDPRTIKTQEQFYDLLVKIKEGGFTDDNGNTVVPLGPKYWGGSADALSNCLRGFDWGGISDGYNMMEDGKFYHEAETKYAMEKVRYFRKLLEEGLVHKEYFTMDTTRADEFYRNHSAAIIGDVHSYVELIYSTGDWLPIGSLNDFTGSSDDYANGKGGYGVMAISADAENPEEIIKLFNYLTTYEGKLLCEYGIEGLSYTMVDGKPVLTPETKAWLDAGDSKSLINNVGAAFDGAGCYMFSFIQTNTDFMEDFGESRPGAGAGDTFAKAVELALYNPKTVRKVEGLAATAYLYTDEMREVKEQMGLLNYKEVLTQAFYAPSEADAEKILSSFVDQLNAAGLEKFKAELERVYAEDPTAIAVLK